MKRSSARSYRGWLVSFFAGGVMTGGAFAANYFLNQKVKNDFHSVRTPSHITRLDHHIADVTRDSLVVQDDALPSELDSDWSEYRSEPSISISMAMDLAAATQLLPPRFEPNAVTSQIVQSRNPEWRKPNTAKLTSIVTANTIPDEASTVTDQIDAPNAPSATLREIPSNRDAWPVPPALLVKLQSLRETASHRSEPITRWCDDLIAIIHELETLPKLNDERIGTLCDQLTVTAEQGWQLAERLPGDVFLVDSQLRLAHAVHRRSIVWKGIWKCLRNGEQRYVSDRAPLNFEVITQKINRIKSIAANAGTGKAWSEYLLLDQLLQVTQGAEVDPDLTRDLARDFLARVSWKRVSSDQRKFLTSEPIKDLANEIQPMAYGPVDFRSVLSDIEAIEEESIHRCRYSLAESVQSLRFGGNPDQVALADTINNYYRNANLRLAVTADMIQRFLPDNQVTQKPVRDKILGSDTRGASTIKTKIGLNLIPDREAWNFVLRLNGDVQSETRSQRGPATFYNSSVAAVDTARHIRISFDGKEIKAETPNVESADYLNGFDTDFDSLPVVGDLMRVIIRQQFNEQKNIAQRIVRRKIASQADGEFDRELAKQFDQAEANFESKLFAPLARLDLNPVLVDMQTTERRLIARYRVAANEQLAAHTPRPSAPSDSHLSFQIHESSLNNALEKIGFSEGEGTIQDLSNRISEALQQPNWTLGDDVPSDITVRFAQQRPITLEFRDGRAWLTLRIDQLRQPNKMNLKKFVIVASYVPVVNGLQAELRLDGPISVDGERLGVRERLPLRTIFAKVFVSHQTIPIVQNKLSDDKRLAGLAISQLDFHDGWLAFAVSEEASPHVAAINMPRQFR